MLKNKFSEDDAIKIILNSLTQKNNDDSIIKSIGDDCAVTKSHDHNIYNLLKVDSVTEGIHFNQGTDVGEVAKKSLLRCLSDIAAMAGRPKFALINLFLTNEQKNKTFFKIFYDEAHKVSKRYNFSIVGGDISTQMNGNTGYSVSVSMFGEVERDLCLFRHRAFPGDSIFVTGKLGGSIAGKHLNFLPRLEQSRFLSKKYKPSSMMDISDGLISDLPRLINLYGDIKLDCNIYFDKIPLSNGCSIVDGLCDGEDYELLFTISDKNNNNLLKDWNKEFPNVELTKIGTVRITGEGNMNELNNFKKENKFWDNLIH